MGVQPGDRVCAILPNIPQTVIAFLACASLGAVWSVCSPDMGPVAVLDRFRQIEPKVLIACDGYTYGGVAHNRLDVLRGLLAELPSVKDVVLLRYQDAAASLVPPQGTAARLHRAHLARRAASRRPGCPSTTRCGSSIRAAPPACPSRSCTATAA